LKTLDKDGAPGQTRTGDPLLRSLFRGHGI
jgi:hypothetical protein